MTDMPDDKNAVPETDQTAPQIPEASESAASACAQCEEYLAGWKRAQADYANLKRETEKEKAEFASYANQHLLDKLLPAIDQFELALEHIPDLSQLPAEQSANFKTWIQGMNAVKSSWEGTFKDIGLEKVSTQGAFDPLIHEAVAHEESATVQDDHVLKVVQPGWRLNGKLLRPARVIVAKRETRSDES